MSEQDGQKTVSQTPPFGVSPAFSYGPQKITKVVTSIGGKNVEIEPQSISAAPTPGTFKVQPLTKTTTYPPITSQRPKTPVGGEIKDSAVEKELLALELQEKENRANILELLVPLAFEFKDKSVESEKLRLSKLSTATAAFLQSAEGKAAKTIEAISENPSSDKLEKLQGELQEFNEALEKARQEKVNLPPEIDQEKELQLEIIKLSGKVTKALQHGRALEGNIHDQAFLTPFQEFRIELERVFVELTDYPDTDKKKKTEDALTRYEESIEHAEEFIRQNPKTATSTASTSPSIPISDLYDQWRTGYLRKFKSVQKEATHVFSEYLRLIKKARKANQLDLCKDIVEQKNHILKEIEDLDPNAKDLPFDLSGALNTFLHQIEEKEEGLDKLIGEKGETKNLEESRKKFKENLQTTPKGFQKKLEQLQNMGATKLTLDRFTGLVNGFTSKAQEIANQVDNMDQKTLGDKAHELEKMRRELEEMFAKEMETRKAVSRGIVMRPLVGTTNRALTEKDKALEFANGKTGEQVALEQETARYIKETEETKRKIKSDEETRKIFTEAFNRDPEGFQDKYVDEREDGRLTMSPALMNDPYKDIILAVLTDPSNPHRIALSEPNPGDAVKDRMNGVSNTERFQHEDKEEIVDRRQRYSPMLDKYGPRWKNENDRTSPLVFKKERPNDPKTAAEKKSYPQSPWGEPDPEIDAAKPKMELNNQELTAPNYQLASMVSPVEQIEKKKIGVVQKVMEALKPYQKNWKEVAAAMVLAGGITMVAHANESTDGTPTLPTTEATVPKDEHEVASVDNRAWEKPWTEKFNEFKNLPSDLRIMEPRQIVKTYCKSFFTNNPSSARLAQVCAMYGDDIMYNNRENTYGLTDAERMEFSNFRRALDDMLYELTGRRFEKGKNRHFEEDIREVQQALAQRDSTKKI